MSRIAILGARGFVGKNLVEHLTGKHTVFAITRNEIDLLDEIAVQEFLKEQKIEVVINCANQGGSRKTGYDVQTASVIGNNLKMFFNIERCLTPDMKMINFGSGAQYNKARDLVKVKEETIGDVIPKDDYGYSKYVMSKYIQAKGAKNIYNPIIFGLYGQKEDYTFKFISNAILKNILNMPIVINQNVVFDYLYLVSIAKIINTCGDHESEIIVKNDGLNFQYTADNTRLRKNIGTEFEFTSYEDGIRELYQYYLSHLDELDLDAVRQDELIKYCKTKK